MGSYTSQDNVEMYAVVPLSWCPHLDAVQPVPPQGLDVEQPCEECSHVGENWVCLSCYEVSLLALFTELLPCCW